MREVILSIKSISKDFPGVRALKDVSLDIIRGEIHGLVGENGAGKSTLIKILGGAYAATSGEMFRADDTAGSETSHLPYRPKTPLDAQRAGISVVHQEIRLVDSLTVKENIFLGREPLTRAKLIDWRRMRREAQEIINQLGVNIDPDAVVGHLTVAQKQIVEICKVLSTQAKIIIMDEPSASLTAAELVTLYTMIRKLKEDGITIIYISHRLEEIFDLCDRVTVLRDGELIATEEMSAVTRSSLISMMVGRELGMEYPKVKVPHGEVILSVRNLNRGKAIRDINFDLHRGEILGFAGLVGAGRTEVARAIMGIDPGARGDIMLKNKPYTIRNVIEAIKGGLGLVSEDRKKEGLVLGLSVKMNISLARLSSIMRNGLLSEQKERELADYYVKKLNIVTPTIEREAIYLSGGNQQKVVIGKWLNAAPDVLIVDEPTRGIDVGSKQEIYNILTTLAQEGKGIIMISSEMPELLGMCDRIAVMCEGRITGILNANEATQDEIMHLALASARTQEKHESQL